MKHYIYKTTNLINGKIYIGKRSHDNPEKDKYLGSGKWLKRSINKHGRDNFKKDILYVYETQDQAYLKQAELVTQQFVLSSNTYNCCTGGLGGRKNMVVVKTQNGIEVVSNKEFNESHKQSIHKYKTNVLDKYGEVIYMDIRSEQFKSGKYKSINFNKIIVKDQFNNIYRIDRTDSRFISGELKSIHKDKITVRDQDGKVFKIDKDDQRFILGQLVGVTNGHFMAKDPNTGEKYYIHKDDPRWINGQLVGVSKGYKKKKEF